TVPEARQSSMSRDGSLFVYNPDVLYEQFTGLVIQRGLPFNHFDNEKTTWVFQNHMQQKYNPVSRTTLKRDAMKLWVAAKQAIIDGFLNLNTNVNLTTDVWFASHWLPGSYICVTAHWIDPSTWQMMKRVIAFEYFLVPYTGDALARVLRQVFVNFNLKDKIMSITLDNASNNTSAIELLIESISTNLEFFDDSHASKAKNGSPTLWKDEWRESNEPVVILVERTYKQKARSDHLLSSEYERYVHSDFFTHLENNKFATFDLLGFWKAKESIFPVLSHMAMAIISVQATLVASESAYSTSERVLLIQRTRLTLASLEMCMCLKDHLDAQERKQDKSNPENPIDFGEEILNADVQQNKAIPLTNEEISLHAASSEGTMCGSGSGGEKVDYDMTTNYGDDY
nr:zinc finger BED domain-containing protein DAYSLEEPER [Tanacetum cinerariifolium]